MTQCPRLKSGTLSFEGINSKVCKCFVRHWSKHLTNYLQFEVDIPCGNMTHVFLQFTLKQKRNTDTTCFRAIQRLARLIYNLFSHFQLFFLFVFLLCIYILELHSVFPLLTFISVFFNNIKYSDSSSGFLCTSVWFVFNKMFPQSCLSKSNFSCSFGAITTF